MKKAIVSAVILLSGLYCTAQETKVDGMKAWQNYMTPAEEHKMLAGFNGTWSEEVTSWMTPGAPPEKSKAHCENTMIMNGLYQQSVTRGNMTGMPFQGISTVGYDNIRKVFVSTWIDNMGSGIMYMEGKWDEASKSITFTGTCTDPMAGKSVAVREVFTIVNENTQLMEMYAQGPDGKEFKNMEIKFTRSANTSESTIK